MSKIDLQDFVEIGKLFEAYGSLLSQDRQKIMNSYFNFNMTLAEIEKKKAISRQAVLDAIDKRFDFWELDMGDWWEDTIETRKYLKELSYPQNGTDYDHLDGYYAFNLLEKLDWEEDTKLTDKSIFIYRILCVLDLADNQDLRLLDAEPTNGVLRKTLAEFIRNKVKSYQNWINKKAKR